MKRRRVAAGLSAVLIGAALLAASPALAQRGSGAPLDPLPPGLTYPEFQGLGCIVGGAIVALSAATYAETVTVGVTTPLVVPIMAAGFVAGCGVGSIMMPGLWWIYRQF